jgi:nucleoside diphosphate kinase
LPWVLERLEAHGLKPRVAAVLPFGVEQMCALYGASPDEEFFVAHPGGENIFFSLQMHGDLYDLAPACLVTVHHPGAAVFEALIGCKGTTQPESSGDGTIRQGGENVIFNLVHAPDSETDARAELTRLLGADIADRLAADAERPTGNHASDVGSVGIRLPAYSGPAATSIPLIVNSLRARIVQRLALTGGVASPEDLLQLTRVLVAERQALLQLDSSRARLLEAQRGSRSLDDALTRAVEPAGEPLLTRGARALAELLDLDGERCPEEVWAMRELVFISPFEWIFLRSHSYGFRPNDTLRSIYGMG